MTERADEDKQAYLARLEVAFAQDMSSCTPAVPFGCCMQQNERCLGIGKTTANYTKRPQ